MTRSRTNNAAGSNVALGAGYLAAGAGSGVICTKDDQSFTCRIKRLVATIQGVMFLALVLFMIYYTIRNRNSIFK